MQVLRADLLLALDEHLDVDRQAALRLEEGGDGAELGGDGALVVGGAAAEEPAVAARSASTGRTSICSSKLTGCTSWWAYRKTVGLPGRAEPFAVGVGVGVAALEDLDVLQPGLRASARRSARPICSISLSCSPSVLML